MSRAFVKEQDVDTVEHLPDRPVSEHPTSSRIRAWPRSIPLLPKHAWYTPLPGFVRAGIDRRRGTRGQILEYAACERATRSCFGRHFRSPVRRHIWLGICCFSKRGGYRPLMQGVLGVGEPAVLRRRIQTSEF